MGVNSSSSRRSIELHRLARSSLPFAIAFCWSSCIRAQSITLGGSRDLRTSAGSRQTKSNNTDFAEHELFCGTRECAQARSGRPAESRRNLPRQAAIAACFATVCTSQNLFGEPARCCSCWLGLQEVVRWPRFPSSGIHSSPPRPLPYASLGTTGSDTHTRASFVTSMARQISDTSPSLTMLMRRL